MFRMIMNKYDDMVLMEKVKICFYFVSTGNKILYENACVSRSCCSSSIMTDISTAEPVNLIIFVFKGEIKRFIPL